MKTILVIAAFVALCYGDETIPTVPGDNSHYVEGESRYIWMPDGEGNPVLADLHEPVDEAVLNSRNGADNRYFLFTRANANSGQEIRHGAANTIGNRYVASRPMMVIVHGWRGNQGASMNRAIRDAFLAVNDGNVIVVDWGRLAGQGYTTAAAGVPGIGNHVGDFVNWLINTAGGAWNRVHFVGFSLGAHVVGVAGRRVGGRAVRVTGLDPAGPGWGNNGNRLSRNAGGYVEAIHTDGRIAGIMNPSGDADFYPNGGRHPQPGCALPDCSHGRSTDLFAATIRHPNRHVGRQCANVHEAELSNCRGNNLVMGNSVLSKRGSGLYGLRTGNAFPF